MTTSNIPHCMCNGYHNTTILDYDIVGGLIVNRILSPCRGGSDRRSTVEEFRDANSLVSQGGWPQIWTGSCSLAKGVRLSERRSPLP